MIYGIVSQLDDATTKVYFKSKKIGEANICTANQISLLVQHIKSGDAVYVVSVNRFYSITQFVSFGKICMARGVALHLLAQPYLDLSNGKRWKPSVMNQMMQMVNIERRAMARMSTAYKYSNEFWDYLCRTFEIMNLEVLAHTFSEDGVMKRGS